MNNNVNKNEFNTAQTNQSIDAHIAEYEALRSELQNYTNRIDSMTGIYITAAFAVIGYLIQPDSTFSISEFNKLISESKSIQLLILLIPTLNSVLLIRVTSFYLGILSIAQYINYALRPRVRGVTCDDCFAWDEDPNTSVKRTWIQLRGIGQAAFIILATILSVAVLIFSIRFVFKHWSLLVLYCISTAFVVATIYSFIAAYFAGKNFHNTQKNA